MYDNYSRISKLIHTAATVSKKVFFTYFHENFAEQIIYMFLIAS